VIGALACAAVSLSAGCDGRAREIRASLAPRELQLFDRGQRLSTPCWTCHDLYGEQHKIGPHLSGVYGRRAGDTSFPSYSDALLGSAVVWNDKTLGRFLSNVQGFMPGTTMVSPGVRSQADLQALLFYLERATAPTL
jgi:cytochrome c